MDLPSTPLSRISINHQVAHDRNPIASHFLSAGVIPADFKNKLLGNDYQPCLHGSTWPWKNKIHENPRNARVLRNYIPVDWPSLPSSQNPKTCQVLPDSYSNDTIIGLIEGKIYRKPLFFHGFPMKYRAFRRKCSLQPIQWHKKYLFWQCFHRANQTQRTHARHGELEKGGCQEEAWERRPIWRVLQSLVNFILRFGEFWWLIASEPFSLN